MLIIAILLSLLAYSSSPHLCNAEVLLPVEEKDGSAHQQILNALSKPATTQLRAKRWRILFSAPLEHTGKIYELTTSPAELFNDANDFELFPLDQIKGHCWNAVLDYKSGIIAAQIHSPPSLVIYNRQMEIIAKYVSPRDVADSRRRSFSCPALSNGGDRIAFVDANGNLMVGALHENTLEFQPICKVLECEGHLSRMDITWINEDRVLVALDEFSDAAWKGVGEQTDIYIADLIEKKTRRIWATGDEIRNGFSGFPPKYAGLVNGRIVVSRTGARRVFLDVDGRVLEKIEPSEKHSERVYPRSGRNIHRISPCGKYFLYDSFSWGRESLVVRELESGREVDLTKQPVVYRRKLTSWQEID